MRRDARYFAASLLRRLQQTHLKHSFCCYGTQKSVLMGIGRASSLELRETGTLDAIWESIHQYIHTNTNEYIFGFIGFDPANQLQKKIVAYQQKIDLFVADIVIECTADSFTILKGNLDSATLDGLTDPVEISAIDICKLDHIELRKQYAESVLQLINAIKSGFIERVTLARKIPSPCEFDLAATFIADYSQHEVARSFYFSNGHIAFAGQSPELLAEGNCHSFVTHKLSGTHEKQDGIPIATLTHRFQNDARIVAEHHSAIISIENSLNNIGQVKVTKFEVMKLPTLLHGWSQFITHPKQPVRVADCLRSIFPFGGNPLKPAFELLAQHENFQRGPYYGLTGCIQPDGQFSFTQVLRSAFIDKNSSYLMAGAAITAHSTPAIETVETCTKLYSIQVFNKRCA